MSENYVVPTSSDYATAIEGLLPQGAAWNRDPNSALMKWVQGCAEIWGDVAASTNDLVMVENDPRLTLTMLPDWETAYGLPDPCLQVVLSLDERRTALLQMITIQGGASRQFFINLAKQLGYEITITEYVPFQIGLSQIGVGGSHAEIIGPTCRFYWTITVSTPRIQRFQIGYSSAGRDSLLEITRADDLECVINRWKPAHTTVLFHYVQRDLTFEFFFPY